MLLEFLFIYGAVKAGQTIQPKKETQMSEKEIAAAKQQEATKVPEPVHTYWPESGIAVFNTQLISSRFLALTRHILKDEDGHGLFAIIFRSDNQPQNIKDETVFGMFEPMGRIIHVNVPHHFKESMNEVLEGKIPMRLGAYFWINLLTTVLHEIYHGEKCLDKGMDFDVNTQEFEADAERYTSDMMVHLAKTVNIEPPQLAEEVTFIAEQIADFERMMTDAAVDEKDEAAKAIYTRYVEMMEGNLLYKDDESNSLYTLKKYYQFSTGEEDDQGWANDVITPADTAPPELTEKQLSDAALNPGEVYDDIPFYEEPEGMGADGSPMAALAQAITNSEIEPPVPGFQPGTVPAAIPGTMYVAPVPLTPAVAPAVPSAAAPTGAVTNAQAQECFKQICLRIHNFIFAKCGYQPGGDVIFMIPGAVLEPIPVMDIPHAAELLVTMDCLNNVGQPENGVPVFQAGQDGRPAGTIRGKVFKNGTLPAWVLHFNIGGQTVRWTYTAQNPNKTKQDGSLTAWSTQIRQGTPISMMMKELNDQERASGISHILATITGIGPNLKYQFKPFG